MRAASLLIVFAIGKAAVLWGRAIPWSWTAIAYVWQDVCVAVLFGVIDIASRERHVTRRLSSVMYIALAGYAALNIPVMMVLSTPLTLPMLRATSGTLADSIASYATTATVL